MYSHSASNCDDGYWKLPGPFIEHLRTYHKKEETTTVPTLPSPLPLSGNTEQQFVLRMMEKEDEKRDIIVRLADSATKQNTLEEILNYLKYEDFKNIEMASAEWKQIISSTNVHWENLFKKNIKTIPGWLELTDLMEWKYPKWINYYMENSIGHKLFTDEVSNSLQVAEENWLTGSFVVRELATDASDFSMLDLSRYKNTEFPLFEMDKTRIARGMGDERIYIWTRWSLDLEHQLEYPDLEENRNPIILPHLHTIQLNDEVVVGEYWPKRIYIWNLEDGERVWERKLDIDITKIHYNCRGIRLRDRFLLSYSATPAKNPVDKDHHYNHNFYLLELTKEGKLERERVLFRLPCYHQEHIVVKDFDFDKTRVVIFHYNLNQAICDIRSTKTGESMWNVAIPETSCDYHRFFVYSDGLVMTGFGANELSIWNVKKQGKELISQLTDIVPIEAARFIGGKYIVTCNAKGHVKVWDLELVLAAGGSEGSDNGLLIHYTESKLRSRGNEDGKVTLKMQADEYQIAFVVQTESSNESDDEDGFFDKMFGMGEDELASDMIYVMDFSEDRNLEELKAMLESSPKVGPLCPSDAI